MVSKEEHGGIRSSGSSRKWLLLSIVGFSVCSTVTTLLLNARTLPIPDIVSDAIPTVLPARQHQDDGRLDSTSTTTSTSSPTSTSTSFIETTPTDVFSACLLTMDDNHFLIEWIAYHYHTLPLRRLIVAVDPNSRTSPSGIFNRWRKHNATTGLTIDEWTDTDFLPPRKKRTYPSEPTNMHRVRQRLFYKSCLQRLKDDNMTWTLLVDSDEYLSANTYTKSPRTNLEQPGSTMAFIKDELAKNVSKLKESPCIIVPRLRYGSVESPAEKVSNQVPDGFNGSSFQTLRFRKHGRISMLHKMPKTIIDVSHVESKYIDGYGGPHEPVRHYCPKKLLGTTIRQSPLVVRHYLGTWEQFFFRDDPRRTHGVAMKTNETYLESHNFAHGEDDAIRRWLKGFVKNVGRDVALELLDGVGDVSIVT